LGRLVDAIHRRPTFQEEDWLILVTTDHGRTAEGGHGGESPEETTVFFMASGPSADVGTPVDSPGSVDLVTTAFAHLGIPIDPAWELDGTVVGLGGMSPVLPFPKTDTLRVLDEGVASDHRPIFLVLEF